VWHNFKCEKYITGQGFITVVGMFKGNNKNDNILIIMLIVYSFFHINEKVVMWEEIQKLKQQDIYANFGV